VWLWLGRAAPSAGDALVDDSCVAPCRSPRGTASSSATSVAGRVGEPMRFSTRRACPKCGFGVPELDPRHFSFNTPQGRCTRCEGSGRRQRRRPLPRAATARGSGPFRARFGSVRCASTRP
jgi:hypothetical protein